MGKRKPAGSGISSPDFSMSDFSIGQLLGGMAPEVFLAEYWQKKPLLVRRALPGFGGWLDRDGLSALASRDDAESRLVSVRRGRWSLEHGPFEMVDLDGLPKRGWSLLISGVNHLLPEADLLLHAFDFVPYARLDDLMVSYAPAGGGVGPHYDSYDVFLIQGQGRRRWEISHQQDLELLDGTPLRILKHFPVDQTWTLESGDMLYLPPKFPHNGVALEDCMTWSVGFRAPKALEMASQFLVYLQDHLEEIPGIYADPDLKRPRHPGEIPTDLLRWVEKTIRYISWNKRDISDFLGRYLSEPKPHVFFDPPARPMPLSRFRRDAAKLGVMLDPRTQLLFRGNALYMNGERVESSAKLAAQLRELADKRRLPGARIRDEELIELCRYWHSVGYLKLQCD